MARYGAAKTESTIGAKSTDSTEQEAAPFPKESVFYRRVSRSSTARTISVSALVKDTWDYIRIDVSPYGRDRYRWIVTPMLDAPPEPESTPKKTK